MKWISKKINAVGSKISKKFLETTSDTTLVEVFSGYASVARKADEKGTDAGELLRELAAKKKGPFKPLYELFQRHSQGSKRSARLSRAGFTKLVRLVGEELNQWFAAYIMSEDVSKHKKMEVIDHFMKNFDEIRVGFIRNFDASPRVAATFKEAAADGITWEVFAARFFSWCFRAVEDAQAKLLHSDLQSRMDIALQDSVTLKQEMQRIFRELSGDAKDGKAPARTLVAAMHKYLQKVVDITDTEVKRILVTLFELMAEKFDDESRLTQSEAFEHCFQDWKMTYDLSKHLKLYARGSYVEVFSRTQCRWTIGIVRRYFISEDYRVWLSVDFAGGNAGKNVDPLDKSTLRPMTWQRGVQVEVKDGDNFKPGVVIIVQNEGLKQWIGIEYVLGTERKKVKVESKCCPRLFRPIWHEYGVKFGYSISLTNVFFDASMGSFRYILSIEGPDKQWKIGRNFKLLNAFWNSIRGYVKKLFPSISFPPPKLIGARKRDFIEKRKNELTVFWRRLNRVLHKMNDETLQKITAFLEIPFVSQKRARKDMKQLTYITLGGIVNAPYVQSEGKRSKPNLLVRMRIGDGSRSQRDTEKWPARNDCIRPTWNATRPVATNGSILSVDVYHDNHSRDSNTKVARTGVDIRQLVVDKWVTVALRVRKKCILNEDGQCLLRFKLSPPPPKKKFLYLIRHGQSKWNAAKREYDLITAFGIKDHGLTAKGANQAEELHQRIKTQLAEGKLDEMSDLYRNFFQGAVAYASPLSRATESAIIALRAHPGVKKSGIRLMADARERRMLIGKDCIGQFRGSRIQAHVNDELEEIFDGTVPEDMKNVKIVPNDSVHMWWNSKAESEENFSKRIDALMQNIIHSTDTAIVLVCHSMVIRHIFKKYLSPDFHREDESLAYDLANSKLQNMGVVGALLDCSKLQAIQKAALMFDSEILDSKNGPRVKRTKSENTRVDQFAPKESSVVLDRAGSKAFSFSTNSPKGVAAARISRSSDAMTPMARAVPERGAARESFSLALGTYTTPKAGDGKAFPLESGAGLGDTFRGSESNVAEDAKGEGGTSGKGSRRRGTV